MSWEITQHCITYLHSFFAPRIFSLGPHRRSLQHTCCSDGIISLALFKFKRIIRTPGCNLLLNWHEASGIWCPRAQGTWTPYGSLKARWVGQQLMDGLVAPYGAPGKTTTLSYCWLGTEIAFKDRLFNQATLLWITTTPHRINVQIFKNSVWNWAPLSTGQCPGSWWWLNHCNDLIIMHCKKEQEGFKNHK